MTPLFEASDESNTLVLSVWAYIFFANDHGLLCFFCRSYIASLFTQTNVMGTSVLSGSSLGLEGASPSNLHRVSSMRRRTFTTGAAALKRKSLCLQVKFQVVSTMCLILLGRRNSICCFSESPMTAETPR